MPRVFRGLREDPSSSYDAVIIGAGVGGLICGNLLAREGLRVLLIEQHYMVGGYCSTFRRKGYTFDAATHFYPLLGNAGTPSGKLLQDLDIRTEWIKMDPVDQFHFPDGSRFAVPADLDTYLKQVRAEFPHELPALDQFFALVQRAYLLGLLYHVRGVETDRLDSLKDLTLRQVLDSHFSDRKLKTLLAGNCAHWGSPPRRTSFVADSMLRLAYFLGNYYPRGGSQVFADEMAQRFEERGGHILMSSRVTRILTEGKTAYGVEVITGPARSRRAVRIRAGVVVSNADLRLTLDELLPPECCDPDYLESVRNLRPTFACFLTHIGVRDVPTELLRKVEGYHHDRWDVDEVIPTGLKIFVPTLFEPRMAPPGGHIVIVEKTPDLDYDSVEDWQAHKLEIEREILEKLESLMPGFSQKIVVCLSASAFTSYKYTLNYRGAMLGWEMSPDQLGERRPAINAPVKNLYFVGHWTQPGGGITMVLVSALRAAKMICAGFDPTLKGALAPVERPVEALSLDR